MDIERAPGTLIGMAIRSVGAHLAEVARVSPDGCAFRAGVRPGAIILSINGRSMVGISHEMIVSAMCMRSKSLRLVLSRLPQLQQRLVQVCGEGGTALAVEGRSSKQLPLVAYVDSSTSKYTGRIWAGDEIAMLDDLKGEQISKKLVRKKIASSVGATLLLQPSLEVCL